MSMRFHSRAWVLVLGVLACVPPVLRAQQSWAPPMPEPRAEDAELLERHESCEHPHSVWLRGEYLLWYIKRHDFPPLITAGAGIDRPGALGQPGTRVLFGGADVDTEIRHGARFTAGLWLDDVGDFGVEASYLFLGSRAIGLSVAGSDATPIVARPFRDVLNHRQDSSLDVFPGLANGRVDVSATSFFDGADFNALCRLFQGDHWQITGLAGFRYLNLDEDVRIEERVQVSPASPRFGGNAIGVTDVFDTQNAFYGAQFGAKFEWRHKRWVVDVLAKVAFGDSHESVRTWGQTTIDGKTVANAGLLVLSSNTGSATRDAFAVVPEAGVNVGYQITASLRLFACYSLISWSDVARPGDQIDFGLNPNLIPTSATFGAGGGPARPALSVRCTDFWAQGANFGVEWRY